MRSLVSLTTEVSVGIVYNPVGKRLVSVVEQRPALHDGEFDEWAGAAEVEALR